MSYAEAAAAGYLRSAIRKAEKQGKRLTRGACGTYDACTNTAGKLPKTNKVCPLCACLLALKQPTSTLTNESLLEEVAAEALGVDTDWVISMLRGFDGDGYGVENEHPEGYRVGKKLGKELGEEVA